MTNPDNNDKSTIQDLYIDSSQWIKKTAPGCIHLAYPFILGSVLPPNSRKFFGEQNLLTLAEEGTLTVFLNSKNLTKIREEYFFKVKNDDTFFVKSKRDFYKDVKKYEEVLAKIDATTLNFLSNEDLCSIFDWFFKSYVSAFKHFVSVGEAVSHLAEDYIEPVFKKKLGVDYNAIFPKLTHPSTPSFLQEETIERTLIKNDYIQNGFFNEKLLLEHSKKFFYIKNNYSVGLYLNPEYFKQEIMTEYKMTEGSVPSSRVNKKSYIKKYKLGEHELFLLTIIDEFSKIIDDRKKNMMKASYYQILFLKELSRRTGYGLDALRWSVGPEYSRILSGEIDFSLLTKRSSGCLVLINDDLQPEFITGEKYIFIKKYFTQEAGSNRSTIKGKPASAGQARGRVKVILKNDDLKNVEKGDVIVTSMTRPEMMPAMKIASAFVTDEGGITCHAATIARELNKPCVIATRIATKTLNTGDLVEVDANNGIVRIMYRNYIKA